MRWHAGVVSVTLEARRSGNCTSLSRGSAEPNPPSSVDLRNEDAAASAAKWHELVGNTRHRRRVIRHVRVRRDARDLDTGEPARIQGDDIRAPSPHLRNIELAAIVGVVPKVPEGVE